MFISLIVFTYTPVIRDGKLYGRGGADDGYAVSYNKAIIVISLIALYVFAAITTIQTLKEQNIPHDRYVVIIEASEESGSPDLPAYIDHLKERIGVSILLFKEKKYLMSLVGPCFDCLLGQWLRQLRAVLDDLLSQRNAHWKLES